MVWHTGQMLPGGKVADTRSFQGYDIHVLRSSTSVPLLSLLLLIDDGGGVVRADAAQRPPDVTAVVFLGQFQATPAGGTAEGGGVRLNLRTGTVEAVPNPPARRLRSFTVTPRVLRTAGAELSGPPVRFHIHERVTEIWLTPASLTIPGDADGQRLSVLARFDDDTVGDITRLVGPPSAPAEAPASGFTWMSGDNACVRVDPQGRLSGVFGLFSCSATVTATLRQPGWPTLSANAQVTVVEPWGDRRPFDRELHLVDGPGLPAVSEVPNILLLPDGFLDTPQDRDDFDKLVALAVHRLNHSASTTPFDVLAASINYWSVFVPSRERGATTLSGLVELTQLRDGPNHLATHTPVTTVEVDGQWPAGSNTINFTASSLHGKLKDGVHFTIAGDPTLYTTLNATQASQNGLRGVRFEPGLAQPVPDKASVTVIAQRVTVDQLIGAVVADPDLDWGGHLGELVDTVGLPVPAERLAHLPSPAELQAKVADWVALYGAARIHPANITDLVYGFWARWLPDHRLADEKDTALGMAIGGRPRAQGQPPSHNLAWHPLRTNRTDVDRFLATLTFNGTVIGTTWTVQPDGTAGKDRNLVFVLSNGARYSGANANETTQPVIAIGLGQERYVRVRHGAGRSLQVEPFPLLRAGASGEPVLTNYLHATIAHETAHSYGILDEYGGFPSLPTSKERDTLTYGNVTPASEVAVAGGITGDRLRWRWPRIRKAGVLAGPPVPEPGAAGVFAVRLVPGRGTNIPGDDFDVGDLVYLRQRPLIQAPTGNPPVLTVARQSSPLTVIEARRSPAGLDLRIQLQAGALDPADYSATGVLAPILLAPVAAAASAAGDAYAELISQLIRRHISATRRPLNAPPAPPQPPACQQQLPGEGHIEPQPARNLPPAAAFPGGRYPAFPLRIVGAYDGGGTFNCGIHRPTGACIMRATLATSTERPITAEAEGAVHTFCTVCRYLLVDGIDPRLHWLIDAFYHDYPQP
jgi:hypothetical protein